MPPVLNRDDLLRTRLDRVTRLLHGVESGDVRAIHQTRVASRRLRELLPVLQLDQDVSEKLTRRLRRQARCLGDIRELDVLLHLTGELHHTKRHSDRALLRVEADIRQARDQARQRLPGQRIAAELARIRRKVEKAARGSKGHRTLRAWYWAIDARVARRAAAVDRAVEDAGALYLPDRLHAVRIAAKKLRYALELALDAVGKAPGADLAVLKRTQTLLGGIHDLQVLADRVRQIQASVAPSDAVVVHDLDALVTELDASCRRLHARYVRSRTGLVDVCRRLSVRTSREAFSSRLSALSGASGRRLRAEG
jgi:CHAD domain-containing protein